MVNTDNVRQFMTNILDGHGNVIVMGEEVIEPEVASEDGVTMLRGFSNTIELTRPMRLILNEKGVIPATFFNSKEWIKLSAANVIEMNIHEKIMELYLSYVQEVFGAGIIMPEEKKIILI
jgi:hypothetical protein